ncbi:glyoxalase [Agromyces sp. NPDC127015]|uniref:glyoxalase n=1 Tax=Agromyces sp. NPDC127015 TaxID=3347108 RepID=UPI003650D62D
MSTIESITLDVDDPTAADRFYTDALGLDGRVRTRLATEPSTGFRGYTLSLVVAQPGNVQALFDAAVAAGATVLKPVAKSLWGVGASVQAPDGAIWKFATSAKKDTVPVGRDFDRLVLLLGVDDVPASKRFYAEHGFAVGKSFGSYVDFDTPRSPIGLGLYKRRALAKDAGVPEEGSGSHRLVIASGDGAYTDPDGFAWAPVTAPADV